MRCSGRWQGAEVRKHLHLHEGPDVEVCQKCSCLLIHGSCSTGCDDLLGEREMILFILVPVVVVGFPGCRQVIWNVRADVVTGLDPGRSANWRLVAASRSPRH